MRNFRRIAPSLVMRLSSSLAQLGPLKASAFWIIERNLKIRNRVPFSPHRLCAKKTGPLESSLIATVMMQISGNVMSKPNEAMTKPVTRLTKRLTSGLRKPSENISQLGLSFSKKSFPVSSS